MSRIHPRRRPSTAFLRPSRDTLIDTCGPISCHCRSWGSYPSEPYPPEELYRTRRPAIPSRRFSPPVPKNRSSRTLRAFCPPGVRNQVGNVSSLTSPLLSWASPLPRLRRLGLALPLDNPSAHGLSVQGVLAHP
jgi:hypothetical protein